MAETDAASVLGNNLGSTKPPVIKTRRPRTRRVQVEAGTVSKWPEGECKIILEENPTIPPTGLFLAVNGEAFMIQTGVEVVIPRRLKDVLDCAVEASPIIDPQTQQVVGWRDRLRYSYRLLS